MTAVVKDMPEDEEDEDGSDDDDEDDEEETALEGFLPLFGLLLLCYQ